MTYKIFNNEFKKTSSYLSMKRHGTDIDHILTTRTHTVGGITVTLEWDQPNADMDLHMYDPDGKHAYYKTKWGIPGAEVDKDDLEGPGSEIFTMLEPKNGKYKVEANYFSDYGTGESAQAHLVVRLGQVILFDASRTMSAKETWTAYEININSLLDIISVSGSSGDFSDGNIDKNGARFTTGTGESLIKVEVKASDTILDNEISYNVFEITQTGKRDLGVSGSGRRFAFNVDRIAPTINEFKSQKSLPLSYEIEVRADKYQLTDKFTLTQDVRSQIRQEYVDLKELYPEYTRGIPDYSSFKRRSFQLNSNYFKMDEMIKNSDYSDYGITEIGQNIVEADFARGAYGYPLVINSSWRNPRRNLLTEGVPNSFHQRGDAIDLVAVKSNVPPELLDLARGPNDDIFYLEWRSYMYNKLCSNMQNKTYDVISHNKDHIHIELKNESQSLGFCGDRK